MVSQPESDAAYSDPSFGEWEGAEMQHDLERHRAAAADAVTRAFKAGHMQGVAEGIAQERARVKALLDQDFTTPAAAATSRARSAKSAKSARSYGNIVSVVRPVLRDLGEAVDARVLANSIDNGVTVKQVRSALHQLVKTGEVTRAERGKYLWRGGESPTAEKPGAGAPGIFNLAAE
jgi:hypothetical protein